MAEEIIKWEYRVQTIGSIFGTKDENIEAALNQWGEGGLGSDPRLYSRRQRQGDHRRQTSLDRPRPPPALHAALRNRRLK